MVRLLTAALALPLLVLPACSAPSAYAVRESFAAQETCPVERVQIQTSTPSRSDGTANHGTPLDRRPPPAVAADPARRAMWNREQGSIDDEFDRTRARICAGGGFVGGDFCHPRERTR